MNKTKNLHFIAFLFFSTLIFGQNLQLDLIKELQKTDSIVNSININEKKYSEGIAEGSIITKSIFRKNGGWEAYFLYKEKKDNPPLRIKYNESKYKTYQKFEFYYTNEQLIFVKLNADFYNRKRKNNPIEKKYYFKNSELIFESNPEIDNYKLEYIKQTEQTVLKMIYE